MQLKPLFAVVFLFLTLISNAQNSKFSVDISSGFSFSGHGDTYGYNFENGISYALSKYLQPEASFRINVAQPDGGTYETQIQNVINTGIQISPFRNNRKLDVSFGGGLTYFWGKFGGYSKLFLIWNEDLQKFEMIDNDGYFYNQNDWGFYLKPKVQYNFKKNLSIFIFGYVNDFSAKSALVLSGVNAGIQIHII